MKYPILKISMIQPELLDLRMKTVSSRASYVKAIYIFDSLLIQCRTILDKIKKWNWKIDNEKGQHINWKKVILIIITMIIVVNWNKYWYNRRTHKNTSTLTFILYFNNEFSQFF